MLVDLLTALLVILTAYLIGGISTGYLLMRFRRGLDIRVPWVAAVPVLVM